MNRLRHGALALETVSTEELPAAVLALPPLAGDDASPPPPLAGDFLAADARAFRWAAAAAALPSPATRCALVRAVVVARAGGPSAPALHDGELVEVSRPVALLRNDAYFVKHLLTFVLRLGFSVVHKVVQRRLFRLPPFHFAGLPLLHAFRQVRHSQAHALHHFVHQGSGF
eukprot:CAMPEP_0171760086 /NCGR_PEP_ID=MMETSP0991-20121206/47266_1 /TAXON_ID=483369 /ORGANISM="non described non described, Strain CCMP2098" /LENGTH=170 /DNA_ID=CAMNT_0012363121 /DNA_START=13 /DNA_END=524 /DNA_ORIENTATION=+